MSNSKKDESESHLSKMLMQLIGASLMEEELALEKDIGYIGDVDDDLALAEEELALEKDLAYIKDVDDDIALAETFSDNSFTITNKWTRIVWVNAACDQQWLTNLATESSKGNSVSAGFKDLKVEVSHERTESKQQEWEYSRMTAGFSILAPGETIPFFLPKCEKNKVYVWIRYTKTLNANKWETPFTGWPTKLGKYTISCIKQYQTNKQSCSEHPVLTSIKPDKPIYCGASKCGHASDCNDAINRYDEDKDKDDLRSCPQLHDFEQLRGLKNDFFFPENLAASYFPNGYCEVSNWLGTNQYIRICLLEVEINPKAVSTSFTLTNKMKYPVWVNAACDRQWLTKLATAWSHKTSVEVEFKEVSAGFSHSRGKSKDEQWEYTKMTSGFTVCNTEHTLSFYLPKCHEGKVYVWIRYKHHSYNYKIAKYTNWEKPYNGHPTRLGKYTLSGVGIKKYPHLTYISAAKTMYCGVDKCGFASGCEDAILRYTEDKDKNDLLTCPIGYYEESFCKDKNGRRSYLDPQYIRVCLEGKKSDREETMSQCQLPGGC